MAEPKMFVLEIELDSDLFHTNENGQEVFAPELGVADLLAQASASIERTGIEARYLKHVRTGQPIGSYGFKEVS